MRPGPDSAITVGTNMESMLGGVAFALFLAAQVFAMIAVQAARRDTSSAEVSSRTLRVLTRSLDAS
jgi:hypothetical protein